MKKLFSILYTAIAVGMVSCAGSGNKPAVDDSAVSNTTVAEATVATHTLSDKGISDIVLGMAVSAIPDSIAGFYNRVDVYDGKSFKGYSFVSDSIEKFHAEDTDFDGKINLIALRGKSPLKADTGNGCIYIGMPEAALSNSDKENGLYRIGNFKIEVQDGKVSEIYIEWSPATIN
ncbi:MAG: hypothetical protein NC388_02895 [Clostridium sp.]|nr:hypothetical protein [Clostridium sp.]